MADLIFKGTQLSDDTKKPAGSPTKVDDPTKPKAPSKVETKSKTELSNWDAQIAPILDNNPELKKYINYTDSKHIMRAVNGRFDKAMFQLKEDDPKAYETFKNFKNNSWALANELKKWDSGTANPKLVEKYINNANAYFSTLQKTFSEDKKKAWVMTDKAQLLDSKSYEKYKQEPDVSKEASNSAKAVFDGSLFKELVADYETGNVSKAYQKLRGYDTYFRENGIDKMAPITKSWMANSLNNLGGKTTNADTNRDGYAFITDSLKHIGKYKTTQDPELAKKDQAAANDILKQLSGKSVEQKYEILKNNSKTINGMTGRMGYYGNAKIFQQYRETAIGTNLNFYPNSNIGKSQMDYFNAAQKNGSIDTHIRNFRDFRKADSEVRGLALENAKGKWQAIKDGANIGDLNEKQMSAAFDSLVDENGNIRSYTEWRKQLGKQFTTTTVLKDQWGYEEKRTENTQGLIKFYNGIATGLNDPGFYTGPAFEQEHKQVWVDAYNKFKRSYKKTFDDVKVKHAYDATLMDIGFGDDRNQAMEYRGVNLSVNKNMRLKETSGPKQENINKIYNLMFDDNGNVDDENITLFSNEKVKSGLSAIQKDDLKLYKAENEETLKEFLKNKNDHITVTFLRHTNVPGQAAYKFYNPETKKSMMMFAPTSMLSKKGGIGEDLYTKTGRDAVDFTFQLKGELTMPVINNDENKPAYQSAALKYDKEKDEYYGETVYWNSEGKTDIHRYTIPYGSQISANSAQQSYLRFLKNSKNTF
jgi:hypothetical protein